LEIANILEEENEWGRTTSNKAKVKRKNEGGNNGMNHRLEQGNLRPPTQVSTGSSMFV